MRPLAGLLTLPSLVSVNSNVDRRGNVVDANTQKDLNLFPALAVALRDRTPLHPGYPSHETLLAPSGSKITHRTVKRRALQVCLPSRCAKPCQPASADALNSMARPQQAVNPSGKGFGTLLVRQNLTGTAAYSAIGAPFRFATWRPSG